MSTSCKTTKLWIPHTFDPKFKICGLLEQLEPEKPTRGRKIALILHGTMGHKDYLFQKRLAKALPLDSFRIDFRGNHETGGSWKMGALHEDLEDIQVVAQYLSAELGYEIDLIVGHSRGSVMAMAWMCTAEEARRVRGFVNISGRYRMEKIHYRDSHYKPFFDSQGYYEWKVNVARKEVVGIIRPQDLDDFASYDASIIWKKFPSETHVFTMHGLKDETVPPYDSLIYARAFGARSSGTHNLHLVEDADHNFTNHKDDVVEAVLAWWDVLNKGGLRTGIWGTCIRGKL